MFENNKLSQKLDKIKNQRYKNYKTKSMPIHDLFRLKQN